MYSIEDGSYTANTIKTVRIGKGKNSVLKMFQL